MEVAAIRLTPLQSEESAVIFCDLTKLSIHLPKFDRVMGSLEVTMSAAACSPCNAQEFLACFWHFLLATTIVHPWPEEPATPLDPDDDP